MDGSDDEPRFVSSWDYVGLRRMGGNGGKLCFSVCQPACPCPTGRRWLNAAEGEAVDAAPPSGNGQERRKARNQPAPPGAACHMTAAEYTSLIAVLGLNRREVQRTLRISRASHYRYASGDIPVPDEVAERLARMRDEHG